MSQTARVYPRRKVEALEKIKELTKRYPSLVLASMHKVRTVQINELRRMFRNEMEIFVSKNRIAELAFKELKIPNLGELKKYLTGPNMFIFTSMDPFRLYILLEKNKVSLPAKGGDIATDDIIIPSGNTGLPPGPILSEFKEVKVPTRIESGSIWVSRDTVVAKKGEVISPKLASLLSKLGIKPIKAGISIKAALWEGKLLTAEDVKVDIEAIRQEIKTSASDAVKLAYYVKYPTKELLPSYLKEAYANALSLAIAADYLTKETSSVILQKYYLAAKLIKEKAKEKGYGE
jgi:large subunit ribosomal protein L10